MSSRRQFIKEAALVGGGVILSTSVFAHYINPARKKVIIIGAGFAGLMAAYKLYGQGIDFEILEARDRIGGRVFSKEIASGKDKFVIELGAEWVGKDHPILLGLCDKFGCKLEDNTFDSRVIYQGKFHNKLSDIESHDWKIKFEALLENYRKLRDADKERLDRKLDKMDWWRYLVDNGCNGTDLDLRDLMDSTDFGESIREVSALTAISEYTSDKESVHNQMDLKIKGGNSRLADKLGELFAHKIRRGKYVVKVEQNDKVRVTVKCKDRMGRDIEEIYTGDKLICTAPAFAVSQIKWLPELPDGMATGLEALTYARINKSAVLFNSRFWDERFDMITDRTGHYFYHATKNQPSDKGVIISYTVGDKAAVIANQAEEYCAHIVTEAMEMAYPGRNYDAGAQDLKYWGNDEFSRGAYAVYGKGQFFDFYDQLVKPYLHTHFAGEHLSDKWGGFMEGALETGEKAAEAIIYNSRMRSYR